MELSKRLFMTASMVERGSIVADVGCDHGYTAIYLVRNGICPRVLAMDVNEGPLARAEAHIREAGLSAYIETRLSDGLSAMRWEEGEADPDGEAGADGEPLREKKPEADTLLMAGIGGRLAARILDDGAEKLFRMRSVILQPQSELRLVRRTLNRLGYRITAEDMVKEEGKFYTAILARNTRLTDSGEEAAAAGHKADASQMPGGLFLSEEVWREAGERYGYPLIVSRHPVLLEYLEESVRKNGAARAAILAGAGTRADGHEEGSPENGGSDRLPERSRGRLALLEGEAALAKRLAEWMRTGG